MGTGGRNNNVVLVVDDDPRMLRLLNRTLELEGYRVLTATNGPAALSLLQSEQCDLTLLDVMMPGLDGYEVCQRIRAFSRTPIILLTARSADEDKIIGLDAGADDYLTKPFSPGELLARVRAVLRRASFSEDKAVMVFQQGDLTVDYGQHLVAISGKEVDLTPTEFKLLAVLVQNIGRVLTYEDLLVRVWGPEYHTETQMLRVYVSRLRQKIAMVTHGEKIAERILTKYGVGYTFARDGESQ